MTGEGKSFRIKLREQKKRNIPSAYRSPREVEREWTAPRPTATEWGNRDTSEGQNVKSFPPVTSAEKRGLSLAVIHQHWQSERERGEGRQAGEERGNRGIEAEQRNTHSF